VNNRWGFLAVLTMTGVTALTGCGLVGAAAERAAAPVPAEDPRQALARSTDAIADGNYTFTVSDDGDTQRGTVHLPQSALLELDSPDEDPRKMVFLAVGKDRYLKMQVDLGADMPSAAELNAMAEQGGEAGKAAKQLKELRTMFDGRHWLHVDPTKLDDPSVFADVDEPDVSGAGYLLSKATTAVRAGATITGTLDLAAQKTDELPWDDGRVKATGAALRKLPYTATLDAQGRLAELVLDMPAAGAYKAYRYVTKVSAYGTTKVQAKPKAVEMSTAMYDTFNE
jgi:hypothetical protein